MEILAGEPDLEVKNLSESGCLFDFDYSKVYWNSRLQAEHDRLVKTFTIDDIVCDMFAGIGPFAIPAAKHRGCVVHANDLNPNSFKYLVHNAKKNKVQDRVHCYNLDGREFVKNLVSQNIPFSQVIMNLPASGTEFLDTFVGLFGNFDSNWNKFASVSDPSKFDQNRLPMVHCYAFSNAPEPEKDLHQRAEARMNGRISPVFVNVRNVAPKKEMILTSFRLPPEIAFVDYPR